MPTSVQDLIASFLKQAGLVTDRWLIPASAVVGILAIAANGGHLSPELIQLAQYYGSAALGSVFAKFSEGKQVTPEEIRDAVEQTFAARVPDDLLTKPEFSRELLQRTTELGNIIGIALRLAEDSIVRRILHGVGSYLDTWAIPVLDLLEHIPEAHLKLDVENQYLVKHINHWEGQQDGILERYVELNFRVASTASPIATRYDKRRLRHKSLSKITVHPAGDNPPSKVQSEAPTDIRVAISEYEKLILLGEPGAGKTTTLFQLAIEAAWKRIDSKEHPIPVLLSLKDWADEPTLLDFIHSHWELEAIDPAVALLRGEVILFLDGLNEIPQSKYERFESLVNWLREYNSPRRIILSSRQSEYAILRRASKNTELPISELVLEALTRNQIESMAHNYLGENAQLFIEKLFPSANLPVSEEPLGLLARNAFMLAALIYIFEPNVALPMNRALLMQTLVERLWDRETDLASTSLSFLEIEEGLARLAYSLVDEGQPFSMPIAYAASKGVALDHLSAAQNASLVELTETRFSFYHQLFLEYFAAKALLKSGKHPSISRMTPQDTAQKLPEHPPPFFAGPIVAAMALRPEANVRWQQSIIMLAGLLEPDENTQFLNSLLDVDPWIVGMCVAQGVASDSTLFDRVVDIFVNTPQPLQIVETDLVFIQMTDSLGKAALPYLRRLLDKTPSPNRFRTRIVEAIARVDDPIVYSLLEDFLVIGHTRGDMDLFTGAMMNLTIMWHQDKERLHILDGYNLERITARSFAVPGIEYAWKYQPKETLLVRRLEFMVGKLDSPTLELDVGVRIDNGGRPGQRLRDPIRIVIASEGNNWHGAEFEPPLELHPEITYWLCYKGMIKGALLAFKRITQRPNSAKSYRPPLADERFFPDQRNEVTCYSQEVALQWRGPSKGFPIVRLLG